MWLTFIFENLNFIVNVLAGLTFILVTWLHFSAWKDTKKNVVKWKIVGFLFLGLSFLFRSLDLSFLTINDLTISQQIFKNIDYFLRLIGYLSIIFGLLLDPLQPKPVLNALFVFSFLPSVVYFYPMLSVLVFLFYIRRSSIGLERHLYPVSYSFLLLSIYELLYSLEQMNVSGNLFLFKLIMPFAVVWQIRMFVLLAVVIVLGRWVIKYLLKQFDIQVFIYQMLLIVTIYFLVTAGFTSIFINDIKSLILNEMKSEGQVVNYSLNDKREKLISDVKYVVSSEKYNLEADSLIVFDKDSIVTYQMEDADRKGSSLSSDNLVKEILSGKTVSDIYVKDNALVPTIYLRAGMPKMDADGKVDGGVIVSSILDSAWIRGFEKNTGLTLSLYAKDVQSAGKDIGLVESNTEIIDKVLIKGEDYLGDSKYINSSYLSYFTPLKDLYNNNVGMLYIGRPSIDILKLMVNSLEIIFASSLALLILSIIPSRLISKSISKQIK